MRELLIATSNPGKFKEIMEVMQHLEKLQIKLLNIMIIQMNGDIQSMYLEQF